MFTVVDYKGKKYEFNSDLEFGKKYGTQIPYGLCSCVKECGTNKIVLYFENEYNPETDRIETIVCWHID
jgi:hypothetical protein